MKRNLLFVLAMVLLLGFYAFATRGDVPNAPELPAVFYGPTLGSDEGPIRPFVEFKDEGTFIGFEFTF